jgi:hypothetical protein
MDDNDKMASIAMNKTITSLSFNVNGRGGRTDAELIGLANEFARLPEHEGISPTPLIRNFLIRKFKEALNAAKQKQAV